MTEKPEPASPPLPKECTCGMYGVEADAVREVAWRWKDGDDRWQCTADEDRASYAFRVEGYGLQPLYDRPSPSPTPTLRTAGETIGGGVQIKPLEWREDDDDGRPMWRARTDTGQVYTVYDDGFSNPPLLLCLHQLKLGSFRSIDPAKAAAQTDYEARIRSALSHPAALSGGDSGAEAEVLREELAKEKARADKLDARINSPETEDWMAGVPLEAAHQIERWGANHDVGKTAMDWFWLIGYLSQKAATSQMAGDLFKAKHHTISTAAALLNWHRHLTGESTEMRPGIDPVARGIAALATAPEGSEKHP